MRHPVNSACPTLSKRAGEAALMSQPGLRVPSTALAQPRASSTPAGCETTLAVPQISFQELPEHVLPPSQTCSCPGEVCAHLLGIRMGNPTAQPCSSSRQSFPSPSHSDLGTFTPHLGALIPDLGSLSSDLGAPARCSHCTRISSSSQHGFYLLFFPPPQGAFSKSLTSRREMIIRPTQTCRTDR